MGFVQQAPTDTIHHHVWIPTDLVGRIVGKGGRRINEIRHVSAASIKVIVPDTGAAARTRCMVSIVGQNENVQTAVKLLFQVSRMLVAIEMLIKLAKPAAT
jgi:poly(rC)-binding protein 2/3/4